MCTAFSYIHAHILHLTDVIIAWQPVGMQPVQAPGNWVLPPAWGTARAIWLTSFLSEPKLQADKHPYADTVRRCVVTTSVLTKRQMTPHYGLNFDQQASGETTVL